MKKGWLRPILTVLLLISFTLASVRPVAAQSVSLLPEPGMMVDISPVFQPCLMRGVKYHPEDPLRFDFLIDSGDTGLSGPSLKDESTKLIKYLLASLTTPDLDLWVNLSPYEGERVIPDAFGLTEMGRDLLAQDYILKQVTSSLLFPEKTLGKIFWARVYARAQELYGTTEVPVETFHKVWIVPGTADIVVRNNVAYVVNARLKLMLEKDYLAESQAQQKGTSDDISTQIMREVILPELTREVNEGKNFATVRQVYSALIVATWLKKKLTRPTDPLAQGYIGRKKTMGVEHGEEAAAQHIWQRYVEAFKKGVFNFIREESEAGKGEATPRKYFSGGADMAQLGKILREVDPAQVPGGLGQAVTVVRARMNPINIAREGVLIQDLWKKNPGLVSVQNDLSRYGLDLKFFAEEPGIMARKNAGNGGARLPVYRHRATGTLIIQKPVTAHARRVIERLALEHRPAVVPIFLDRNTDRYYELYLADYETIYDALYSKMRSLVMGDLKVLRGAYEKGLKGYFDSDTSWQNNSLVKVAVPPGEIEPRIVDMKVIDFEKLEKLEGDVFVEMDSPHSSDQQGKNSGEPLFLVRADMTFSEKNNSLEVAGDQMVYVGRGSRNFIFVSPDQEKVYRVRLKDELPATNLKTGFDLGASQGITPKAFEDGLTSDGHYFLAVEYVQGESLDHVSRMTPERIRSVERLLEKTVRAGLLLPDWRPANIMIKPDGHAIIADAEFVQKSLAGSASLAEEYWLGITMGRYNAEWKAVDPQGKLVHFLRQLVDRLSEEAKEASTDMAMDTLQKTYVMDSATQGHLQVVLTQLLERLDIFSRFVEYFLGLDFSRMSSEEIRIFLEAIKDLSGGMRVDQNDAELPWRLRDEFAGVLPRHPALAAWFDPDFLLKEPVLEFMRRTQMDMIKAHDDIGAAVYNTILSGARMGLDGRAIGLEVEIVNAWFSAIYMNADMLLDPDLGWKGNLRESKDFQSIQRAQERFHRNIWVFLNKLKDGTLASLPIIYVIGIVSKEMFVIDAKAVMGQDKAAVTPGGIDLNTRRMEMNINEDAATPFVASSAAGGSVVGAEIQGLTPVILGIEAIESAGRVLGLAPAKIGAGKM